MSHQDKRSSQFQQQPTATGSNAKDLKRAIDWLFTTVSFQSISVRRGSKWKPLLLASTALFWVVSDRNSLTTRFFHARKITMKMFCRQPDLGKSYQGFIKILKRWNTELIVIVTEALRTRMKEDRAADFMVAGFPLFATDGSRVETPRTQSNKKAFSPLRKKREHKQRNERRPDEKQQRNNLRNRSRRKQT